MRIHKEGFKIILTSALLLAIFNITSFTYFKGEIPWLAAILCIISIISLLFIILFFRVPKRDLTSEKDKIVCPADGKIVAIEEITDNEYFKDSRIQVSIFMSPLNVHLNRNPVSGDIIYKKYHKGKYLVAWHPKSSTKNERHSIVIENENGSILVKQIAGALAKRIRNYTTSGQQVVQNGELGFIKFGSRVDVLLPLDAKINVQLNDNVKSGVTVLGSFK